MSLTVFIVYLIVGKLMLFKICCDCFVVNAGNRDGDDPNDKTVDTKSNNVPSAIHQIHESIDSQNF